MWYTIPKPHMRQYRYQQSRRVPVVNRRNPMLGLAITRHTPLTLSRQIHDQIAGLILAERLHGGDALPSTRGLAESLGVSRNTVNEAYEMLRAEGYIAGRPGAGFSVEEHITLKTSRTRPEAPPAKQPPTSPMTIRYDFRTGIPDVRRFPFAAWKRIQRDILETIKPGDMLYGSTQGYEPLREAIADWLLRSRGMRTDKEKIFITNGATRAISLAAELLCRDTRNTHGTGAERAMIVENPSYLGITRLLRLKNIPYTLCAVDEHGMRTEEIEQEIAHGAKPPAGVYVTPSHQFPLGCVLSAPRRAHLVDMARKHDFHIIEDDYDSEFRYGGAALSPLHSLDPERVVYAGTFSKTLFPALRVGFAVAPSALRRAWTELHRYTDVQYAIVEQATLHRFLEQRAMDRHIRSMTKLYGRKRAKLIAAIGESFGADAEVLGDGAGLHLALRLPGKRFGKEFRERCKKEGAHIMPCSRYMQDAEGTGHGDTLLLGYGNIDEERVAEGIRLLKKMTKTVES